MLQGLEFGFIFRHPLFFVTFIIAVPAWIIAFVAQCAAEAQLSTGSKQPVVSYLWYSIWIQLAVIIHLFLAAGTDQLALHRFQLAIGLAIAEVFAVLGTNFIYSDRGQLIAVGVGWLLTAIVDLVWLLYLTSEEDTFLYRLLTIGGTGGLSGHSRTPGRTSGAAYSGGESGMGGGMQGGYSSTPRLNGGSYGLGGGAGGYAPADTTPQKMTGLREDFSHPSPAQSEDRFKQKAKAQYAYSASPDDPNEVSFAKGDILDVIDNTGKWFQVRTPSGQTGIAPSNYLTLL